MDTKLTLKLKGDVIERAKIYAKDKKTSLSSIVESYLNMLTEPKFKDTDVTPLVKSISGVIAAPKGDNFKKIYKSHLTKKYAK